MLSAFSWAERVLAPAHPLQGGTGTAGSLHPKMTTRPRWGTPGETSYLCQALLVGEAKRRCKRSLCCAGGFGSGLLHSTVTELLCPPRDPPCLPLPAHEGGAMRGGEGKGPQFPGGRKRAEEATSELLSRPLSVCSKSAPYLWEDSHKRLAIVMIPEGV